jgi:hypothetical protein
MTLSALKEELSLNTFVYSIVLIALVSLPLRGMAEPTTEAQLDQSILSIDRDIRSKNWARVIKRGPEILAQCTSLATERDPRCIALLRNINYSYIRSGRINEIPGQIKKAYLLSASELGEKHSATVMSRDYYYKLLLFREKYKKAIPILNEIIKVEKARNNDEYEILERLTQLYALYGLTEQFTHEETTLVKLLALTGKLLGDSGEDYKKIAVALAENYCAQKKYYEFFKVAGENKLDIRCPH